MTLARFDAVYHYHFKVNLRPTRTDYLNLWGYARDLYLLHRLRGHNELLRPHQAALLHHASATSTRPESSPTALAAGLGRPA